MADDPNPNDDPNPAEPNDDPQDVDALIAAAVAKEKARLLTKNRELLDKLATAQTTLKAYDGMDPEDVRERLDQLEELQARTNPTDGDGRDAAVKAALAREQRKAERERERISGELSTAQTELQAARKQNMDMVVELALDKAIDDAKVAPPFKDLVRAFHRDRVAAQLADEGDVSHEAASQIATDLVKSFAASDQGKHVVAAAVNNGGGARGAGNGTGSGPDEAKYFDPKSAEFNQTKQGEVFLNDPVLYNKLFAQFGLNSQ